MPRNSFPRNKARGHILSTPSIPFPASDLGGYPAIPLVTCRQVSCMDKWFLMERLEVFGRKMKAGCHGVYQASGDKGTSTFSDRPPRKVAVYSSATRIDCRHSFMLWGDMRTLCTIWIDVDQYRSNLLLCRFCGTALPSATSNRSEGTHGPIWRRGTTGLAEGLIKSHGRLVGSTMSRRLHDPMSDMSKMNFGWLDPKGWFL